MKALYRFVDDRTVIRAKNPLYTGGVVISNPSEELLRSMGYMELEPTLTPVLEEGQVAVPVYAVRNGKIVQSWVAEEVHENDAP